MNRLYDARVISRASARRRSFFAPARAHTIVFSLFLTAVGRERERGDDLVAGELGNLQVERELRREKREVEGEMRARLFLFLRGERISALCVA